MILARRARKRSTFKCFTEDTANKTETNFLQSILIYSKVERLCADPKRRSCLSMCWYIPKEPEESEKKKRLNQRECVKNRRTLPEFCQSEAKKEMNACVRIYTIHINMNERLRCCVPKFACVNVYVGDIMCSIAFLSVASSHHRQTEAEKKWWARKTNVCRYIKRFGRKSNI